jgi:hypothetical protein
MLTQESVQVRKHTGGLYLDRLNVSNRLNMKVHRLEFILYGGILSENDNLDDNVRLLLRAQAPVERVKFTDGHERLEKKRASEYDS